MLVEAYSKEEAFAVIRQEYGWSEEQVQLITVKKPVYKLGGLIKIKGKFEAAPKRRSKKAVSKTRTRQNTNGSVEIKNGLIRIKNPVKTGSYPSIFSDDPNVDVFINGKKLQGAAVLTANDKVVFKARQVEPVTKVGVELSKDKLTATLKIYKEKGKQFYVKDAEKSITIRIVSDYKVINPIDATIADCVEALTKANVKLEFVDMQAIEELVKLPEGGKAVVAKGKEPIGGSETKITFCCDVKALDATGLSDSESIEPFVEIGDVIATKVMPAIRGKDGIAVTGEIIMAKEVKDKHFKVGQGAVILDNGNKVVAATSGTPILKDGVISVIPLLILSGDVDVKTGHIDFNGNILIKGNVMDNSKVTARGMIKILGSVYNSEVIAGEDIKIFGGVIGSNIIAGTSTVYFIIIQYITKMMDTLGSMPAGISEAAARKTVETSMLKAEKLLLIEDEANRKEAARQLQELKGCFAEIDLMNRKRTRNFITLLNDYAKYLSSLYTSNANLSLRYTENSIIQAYNILITGEGSYLSNLLAGHFIIYTNPTSCVKGGVLMAGQKIKAGVVGSYTGIKTYCTLLEKSGTINVIRYYSGTVFNMLHKVSPNNGGIHKFIQKSEEMAQPNFLNK